MRRLLRFILWTFAILLALTGTLAALAGYFLYTPDPEPPHPPGAIVKGAIEVDGQSRTYKAYLPPGLPKGAPLILALHGVDENSAAMRIETGYAFERLADQQGFAVVYPDAHDGHWNSCAIDPDSEEAKRGIDDVKFLTALADKFIGEDGIDPDRIFAAGLSDGGDMVIRLALEAPQRFRAVAPVAANVQAPGNFKCQPVARGGSSVILIHGTKDPLVPFDGGEGSFFGFFPSGQILSTRASGQYFADLNGIAAPAQARPDHTAWTDGGTAEIELIALEGAGHVFPQPYYRARRILGRSPTSPNAAEEIWTFFARQKPR